jgi:hypothetical protein
MPIDSSNKYTTEEFLDFFKNELRSELNAIGLSAIVYQSVLYNPDDNKIFREYEDKFIPSMIKYMNDNLFVSVDKATLIMNRRKFSAWDWKEKSVIYKLASKKFEIHPIGSMQELKELNQRIKLNNIL